MGFGNALASPGPYTNNLHLTPSWQPHQHTISQFLHSGCSSWRPTNSVKHWRTARLLFLLSLISVYCLCLKSALIKHLEHVSCSAFLLRKTSNKMFYLQWTCTILPYLAEKQPPFCGSRHLQIRTGGFCWCKVLLPACPCWRQPVHSD